MSAYSATSLSNDTTYATCWNGPICQTCGARYLGSHTCTAEDILRRVGELLRALPPSPPQPDLSSDRTRGCPCRPENGGSGVCGCIFGGVQVTC